MKRIRQSPVAVKERGLEEKKLKNIKVKEHFVKTTEHSRYIIMVIKEQVLGVEENLE